MTGLVKFEDGHAEFCEIIKDRYLIQSKYGLWIPKNITDCVLFKTALRTYAFSSGYEEPISLGHFNDTVCRPITNRWYVLTEDGLKEVFNIKELILYPDDKCDDEKERSNNNGNG